MVNRQPSLVPPIFGTEKVLLSVKRTFFRHLKALKPIPYMEAVEATVDFSGVYLIYDQNGVLLYAGQSEAVRSRLRGHLSKGGALMEYLLKERINISSNRGHRCRCGDFIGCRSGEEEKVAVAPIAEEIKKFALSNFKVSVLSGNLRKSRAFGSRDLERLVQWMLSPKYGFWPDLNSGMTKIPTFDEKKELGS